jgi:hypothetical protein
MLARVALRLAAVEALAPYAALVSGPWKTIAGGRVYDSRQDPIDGLDEFEARPVISIYTEEMTAEPYGSGLSRPDHVTVDLVCELMMLTKGSVQLTLPDGSIVTEGTADMPISERAHEALLDLLEATVRRRLEARHDFDAQTELFRRVCKEIRQISSVPQRDSTRTVRLAARTVTFRCVVAADRWPDPALAPQAASGLDRLPEPLRAVALAMPAGSSARAVCERLASLLADPAALTPLALIDLGIGLDRLPDAKTVDQRAKVTF